MISVFIFIPLFVSCFCYAHEAKPNTDVKNNFLLRPELTPYALTRITTTAPSTQKSVSIWLLDGDKTPDYKAFITSLPKEVSLCVSPFDEASVDLIAFATEQKRDVALVINTQTRLDGDACSAACFNATNESIAFFQHFVDTHTIKTIFLPDSTDIDTTVLTPLIDFLKKNKLHVLLPPQLFSNLATLLKDNQISYRVLHMHAPNNLTFNDYKQHLADSMSALEENDLMIALSASSTPKKIHLQTYLETLIAKQIIKK